MRNIIFAAAAALTLGGCAQSLDSPLDAPLSANFGEAVASMNVQIIPTQVSDLPPEDSGFRSAAAVGRYHKDEVKQPPTSATSELSSQLGSLGASGGYGKK